MECPGSEHGQGTSAEYEINDDHRVSPPGNLETLRSETISRKTGDTVERRTRRLLYHFAEYSARQAGVVVAC